MQFDNWFYCKLLLSPSRAKYSLFKKKNARGSFKSLAQNLSLNLVVWSKPSN